MALSCMQPGGGQVEHGMSVQRGLSNALSLLENIAGSFWAAVAECKNNTCVFVSDNVMGVCFMSDDDVRRQ